MEDRTKILWEILLGFRRLIANEPQSVKAVYALHTGDKTEYFVNDAPVYKNVEIAMALSLENGGKFPPEMTVLHVDEDFNAEVLQWGSLLQQETGFLLPFVALCALPLYAFRRKRAISILHLAQSIDGRMATLNHNSKWISNSENLIYAHRMRALADSILIGSNTLMHDKPALTVRYVDGPNPAKVIVGDSAADFSSVLKSTDRVIHLVTKPVKVCKGVDAIMLDGNPGHIRPLSILQELYRQGYYSVYIEGGAFTLSEFIRERAADIINFYIAPVILGSGISIEVQGIARIEDAISLCNCNFYPMGNGMLVKGCIKSRET